MAKMKIFRINSIQLSVLRSDPPQLSISVTGDTTTAGWTAPELKPLEKKLSADGILDLEFVAEPPDGIAAQVISPTAASFIWKDDVERIVGVRVVARSNDPIQMLNPGTEFTTLALGEEGPPTTLALGEEGPQTTIFTGEEGPGTTPVRGEEGPGTTPFVGEEDPGTTPFVGEEDPGTTPFVGEEGPEPSTRALGEEGPVPTTLALGEEGPGPTTLMVGEEGPEPTTAALGEEGGGTTFAVGEEGKSVVGEGGPGGSPVIAESGASTAATGEEPGGNPSTAATGEETGDLKGVTGEGVFDPFTALGNRNPFGRR